MAITYNRVQNSLEDVLIEDFPKKRKKKKYRFSITWTWPNATVVHGETSEGKVIFQDKPLRTVVQIIR